MSGRSLSTEEEVVNLKQQLSVARNEIHNLRQMIRNIGISQQKEVERIETNLESWRCSGCQKLSSQANQSQEGESNASLNINYQPIGEICTSFPKKRAIPRQPGISFHSQGKITLFNTIFTNPEHSLEGLGEFSHMWIIFHFHQNESSHIRAKVSPPRLNGVRTGVFGTRSPHRPCPIGLSLVQIDKIEGSCIYFSGVDMMNGTPVLDLKPYIPQYDNPLELDQDDTLELPRQLEGQESESLPTPVVTVNPVPNLDEERRGQREAPDGEEGLENNPRPSSPLPQSQSPLPSLRHVRVPAWIAQPPVSQLSVSFITQAETDLSTLQVEENTKHIISDVLREDPRSAYVRERYANQFYTFLIKDLHVSCKFDDTTHSVKVYRIRPAEKLCECGQPEWQCSLHADVSNS